MCGTADGEGDEEDEEDEYPDMSVAENSITNGKHIMLMRCKKGGALVLEEREAALVQSPGQTSWCGKETQQEHNLSVSTKVSEGSVP